MPMRNSDKSVELSPLTNAKATDLRAPDCKAPSQYCCFLKDVSDNACWNRYHLMGSSLLRPCTSTPAEKASVPGAS